MGDEKDWDNEILFCQNTDFVINIINTSPAYIVKRCIQGNFCERLYRRKSGGNCGVYYRDKGDSAADREEIWGK